MGQGPEHHKTPNLNGKQAGPTVRSGLDPMDLAMGINLKNLKELRDDIDPKISRLSTLSDQDRWGLAIKIELMTNYFRAVGSIPITSEHPVDGRFVNSLGSLARVLKLDPAQSSPKQYEVAVKEAWKAAKKDIDRAVASPSSKQLIEKTESALK